MRITYELSQNWRFSKTCSSAPTAFPTDPDWEAVTLPHTWNAVDGQIGTPFDRGAYWYVTTFTPPKQPLPGGRPLACRQGDLYRAGASFTYF